MDADAEGRDALMAGTPDVPARAGSPGTLCLVADIGGTNARFAIARLQPVAGDFGCTDLEEARNYLVRDFATPADALKAYVQALPADRRPRFAVLAVAGTVTGDQVLFTNNHWSFSIAAMTTLLGVDTLHVVNDFAAVAWALPWLAPEDMQAIGIPVRRDVEGVRVVLGPGTGLGLAAIKSLPEGYTVLETEGGHVSFAPRNDDEMFLLSFLGKRYGRVSYERLLCGEGLVNIYDARCARAGIEPALRLPEQVSRAAHDGDAAAAAATRDFCSIFGAFAGDAALMYGAWGGVYLAGGLLPHVFDATGGAIFRASFEDKGRFAPLLRNTPTIRILRSDVGNLGAAAYGARFLDRFQPRPGGKAV